MAAAEVEAGQIAHEREPKLINAALITAGDFAFAEQLSKPRGERGSVSGASGSPPELPKEPIRHDE